MLFHEKLTVYETVIDTLKNQADMVSTLAQLPLHMQVEGVRFMEFLNDPEHMDAQPPTTSESEPRPPGTDWMS